ncbi:hypothetical protein DS843_24360 [Roseomonas genomospecies 6]|uniref:Uncharacterized protein n=2 Tax=Roseomonas genomospecies 6 TaxID=214106 RepID=A0A9W7KPY2_9PROT|nr:hypothetical protein DS843_24360 [Roseomonas genomospecies 6]
MEPDPSRFATYEELAKLLGIQADSVKAAVCRYAIPRVMYAKKAYVDKAAALKMWGVTLELPEEAIKRQVATVNSIR